MASLFKLADESLAVLKEKAPLILTMTSIGLGVTATAMAVKVTPEANDIYKQIMSNDIITPQQKKLEVVRNVIPLYIPAALTGAAAAGTGIASYAISKHRLDNAYEHLAGLSTAYILAQEKAQNYKKAVIEKFGENVNEEVEKHVAEEEAKRRNEEVKEIIISNDSPEEIMQDSISGQYFKNTRDQIYLICNELQHRLTFEDSIPASDYFYEAGITQNTSGDDVGWLVCDKPWPKFTDFFLPDGRKAVLVQIDTNPLFRGYKNYY